MRLSLLWYGFCCGVDGRSNISKVFSIGQCSDYVAGMLLRTTHPRDMLISCRSCAPWRGWAAPYRVGHKGNTCFQQSKYNDTYREAPSLSIYLSDSSRLFLRRSFYGQQQIVR